MNPTRQDLLKIIEQENLERKREEAKKEKEE